MANINRQAIIDIQCLTLSEIRALCTSLIAHLQEEQVALTKDEIGKFEDLSRQIRKIAEPVHNRFNDFKMED